MKIKEKENWLKLYDIAEKIGKEKPWEKLWDTDLFAYTEDENPENALYYCTMGKGGMHKAVAVYQSRQIAGYLQTLEDAVDGPMAINYLECIKVCYLPKRETIDENIKIIKELGLNFKKDWISFEKYERGYEYSTLNEDDILFMTKALTDYYEMYQKYSAGSLKPNFPESLVIRRDYNTKDKTIKDYIGIAPLPTKEKYETIEIDKKLGMDLISSESLSINLELEMLNYLPVRIKSNKGKDGRHRYPLLFIMADKKSQYIFEMYMGSDKTKKEYEKYIYECMNKLTDFILNQGRPRKIYVRDERTKIALTDLANKAGIDLVVKSNLPAIDFIISTFLNGGFME